MAGETTALITFAHRSVFEEIHGPAGSRIWRPGYVAAMVEKHVPVWVVTPIAHAAHSYPRHQIVLCNPDITGPLEMDLMPLMASLFDQGNQALKSQAEREELLHSEAGTWWINSKTKNLELEEEFDENGEPNKGFYTLYIPIEMAKCRWGDASSSAKAEIQIVNSDGKISNTTVAASNENGNLRFNVAGFGSSSPPIKVRMAINVGIVANSSKSTPKVTREVAIKCVRGKTVKKIKN